MGSVVVVIVHSAGSFAAVVVASERWVSASKSAVTASKIEGAIFALASAVSSFVVA
jgi:isopentenyl phosphate kinase